MCAQEELRRKRDTNPMTIDQLFEADFNVRASAGSAQRKGGAPAAAAPQQQGTEGAVEGEAAVVAADAAGDGAASADGGAGAKEPEPAKKGFMVIKRNNLLPQRRAKYQPPPKPEAVPGELCSIGTVMHNVAVRVQLMGRLWCRYDEWGFGDGGDEMCLGCSLLISPTTVQAEW